MLGQGRRQVQHPLRELGFEEAANLDDGRMWPTSYALMAWTPAVAKKVAQLVKTAAS